MGLKLYMYESSLPARTVLMTAAALGIPIEKKIVDMANGEHMSAEFLKINPQHCIPTLVDGDYAIWESHAINPYLAEKYGKDDWLYPKNLEKRGTIMQRLHLNNSTIYPLLKRVSTTIFEQKSKELSQEQIDEVSELYKLLDSLLERTRYLADNHATVADISVIVCVDTAEMFVPIDAAKYTNLSAWVRSMRNLPCYQVNVPGFEIFKAMIEERLKG